MHSQYVPYKNSHWWVKFTHLGHIYAHTPSTWRLDKSASRSARARARVYQVMAKFMTGMDRRI